MKIGEAIVTEKIGQHGFELKIHQGSNQFSPFEERGGHFYGYTHKNCRFSPTFSVIPINIYDCKADYNNPLKELIGKEQIKILTGMRRS